MAQARDAWVDYAKAIGILLVVYGHVARGVHNAGIPMDAALYELVDSIIYSFHMPLFFFLSGLFFLHSLERRGPGALTANKIDTIVYPYVLWSLIQGLTEVALYAQDKGVDLALQTHPEITGNNEETKPKIWTFRSTI